MRSILKHYGVLGMKWGIRKSYFREGHTIKAGTTMYRVSAGESENLGGATYVTYLPPDRDLYRGEYAQQLAKNQTGSYETKMYEKTLKTTKDLKVPSRQELQEITADVFKNKTMKLEMLKGQVKIMRSMGDLNDEGIARISEKTLADFYDGKMSKAKIDKILDKKIDEVESDYIKALATGSVKWTPEQGFANATRALGMAPSAKNAIISELTKRGYNAMMDEASVGGIGGNAREGVAPMIIFDGKASLQQTKSKKITTGSMYYADHKRAKWKNTSDVVVAITRTKDW